jgi:hypothetical protein
VGSEIMLLVAAAMVRRATMLGKAKAPKRHGECCVLCVVRGDRHCGGGKLVSVGLYELRHM